MIDEKEIARLRGEERRWENGLCRADQRALLDEVERLRGALDVTEMERDAAQSEGDRARRQIVEVLGACPVVESRAIAFAGDPATFVRATVNAKIEDLAAAYDEVSATHLARADKAEREVERLRGLCTRYEADRIPFAEAYAKPIERERDEARAQAAAMRSALLNVSYVVTNDFEPGYVRADREKVAGMINAVVDATNAGRDILDALAKAEAALRAARSGLPMILARVTYAPEVASDDDDAIGPAPVENGRGPWECGCGGSHVEIEKIPHTPECEWSAMNAALAAIQALGIRGGSSGEP